MTRDPLNDDISQVETSPKFEGAVGGFSDVIKSKRETEKTANWFAMHHQRDIKEMELWVRMYSSVTNNGRTVEDAARRADFAVEAFRKRYPRIDAE